MILGTKSTLSSNNWVSYSKPFTRTVIIMENASMRILSQSVYVLIIGEVWLVPMPNTTCQLIIRSR